MATRRARPTSGWLGFVLAVVLAMTVEAQPRRAPRPNWSDQETGHIFFEDAFRQALKGERPVEVTSEPADEPPASPSAAWSDWVSASTLENEIKQVAGELRKQRRPAAISGADAVELRHRLQHLAGILAVIANYDGEIRWQREAGGYADRLAQLATQSARDAPEALERAQAALDDLLAGRTSTTPSNADVSTLATRPAMMFRLQQAEAQLQAAVANPRDFKRRAAMIARETEMIALHAALLTLDGMDDSADDDYVELCDTLRRHAQTLGAAADRLDFEGAREPMGAIRQSCTDCHEMYRG